MAVTGKFGADFDDFYDAVQKADAHLRGFESNSAAVERRLNAVSDAFSGRRIMQEATIAVKAVEEVGGATALTGREQEKVNALITDAITKYAALGKEAPADMLALHEATKKVEAPTSAISASVIALGTSIGTMAADAVAALGRLAIEGIGKAAVAFGDLVLEGGEVSDISTNFDHLATSAGAVASTMLGELRTGTHNTIADFDLMRTANEQMSAGLVLSDGDMRTLAEGAYTLAQATGKDVKTALDEMSGALVNGQVKVDGLTDAKINAEGVELRYALSLGKTRDQLTPDEALYARRQSLLEAVATATARVGEQTDGIGEKVQQAAAKWDNFRQKLAMSIADSPVLAAGLDAVQTALARAFGGDQEALIAAISKGVNQAAIYAIDLALGFVELARSGIEAWGTLKTPIDLITVAITEVVTKTAGGIASMLELAAAAPGVGSAFEAQATAARAVATEYGNINTKAHEQLATDRALATGQGAVHDALNITVGVLGETKAAMEAARLHTTAAGTAIDAHAAAARGGAGDVKGHAGATDDDVEALRKQEAALKAAAAEQKKMEAAMKELASVGVSWKATLDGLDAGVVAMAEAYIRAGASSTAIQTALGLTDGAIKAINESIKAQDKAIDDSVKKQQEWAKAQLTTAAEARGLWDEYEKLRNAQTKTATDQQIAEVERWKRNLIAKHQEAGTYSEDMYRAIEATAAAKLDAINVDWQTLTTSSQANLQNIADKALATFNVAREGHSGLTLAQIDDLERIALAAQDSANGYSAAFVDAGATVGEATETAAERAIAANKRITDDAASSKLRLDQITGVYQSAGARSMSGATGSFQSTSLVGVAKSEWDAKAKAAGGVVMYDTYNNPYIYIPGVNASSGKMSPDAYGARSAGGWEQLAGARAAGGPVSAGGAYLVGEDGPEVFIPGIDGRIAPGTGGASSARGFDFEALRADWVRLASVSQTTVRDTAAAALAAYDTAAAGHGEMTAEQIDDLHLIAAESTRTADEYAAAFTAAGAAVSTALATVTETAVDSADRLASSLTGAMDRITDGATSSAERLASSLTSTIRTVADTVQPMIAELMGSFGGDGGAAGGLGGLGGSLAGLFGGGGMENIGGVLVPGRAAGGPVTAGGAYVVGERGPELFVPRTDGRIDPRAAAGGSVSVVVNVSGAIVGTASELARLVGDAMIGRLRAQGVRLPAGV